MGKLNIAHHKSYHPYRRDNIERVRRDEEEAKLKEQAKEGKMMLADAEARIDLLRQRAGLSEFQPKRQEDDKDIPQAGPSSIVAGGHINLFEDLERHTMAVSTKVRGKQTQKPDEQGVPLAPSEKDMKPWYSDRNHERNRESEDDRKLRDLARKSVHDPLTSINHQLAARSPSVGGPSNSRSRPRRDSAPQQTSISAPPAQNRTSRVAERLGRESSERQRALELIRRKKRESEASMTPSTVRGGMDDGPGYGDQFNRREVEEAHKSWERQWERNDNRSRPRRW